MKKAFPTFTSKRMNNVVSTTSSTNESDDTEW